MKFNRDTALKLGLVYCRSGVKHSNFFVQDTFSENEAGMKTKTVVVDIPLNFCSTDGSCFSTNGGYIMRYRYSISRLIAGTNQFFKMLSIDQLMESANIEITTRNPIIK